MNTAEKYSISTLSISIALMLGLIVQGLVKVKPCYHRFDPFTKMIVWLVFAAISFEVLSLLLAMVRFSDRGDIFEESATMRDARLAMIFSSTVTYSLVFNVIVFRMLYRWASYNKSRQRSASS